MALNLGSAAKTPGPQHRRYLHDLANESHPFRRSTWRDVARDGTGFFSTHCHVLHFVLMYMHSRVSRSQHGRHVMNRKKREREREREGVWGLIRRCRCLSPLCQDQSIVPSHCGRWHIHPKSMVAWLKEFPRTSPKTKPSNCRDGDEYHKKANMAAKGALTGVQVGPNQSITLYEN